VIGDAGRAPGLKQRRSESQDRGDVRASRPPARMIWPGALYDRRQGVTTTTTAAATNNRNPAARTSAADRAGRRARGGAMSGLLFACASLIPSVAVPGAPARQSARPNSMIAIQ
jgi:hypothetical protein